MIGLKDGRRQNFEAGMKIQGLLKGRNETCRYRRRGQTRWGFIHRLPSEGNGRGNTMGRGCGRRRGVRFHQVVLGGTHFLLAHFKP
jgi:hypothetical protein